MCNPYEKVEEKIYHRVECPGCPEGYPGKRDAEQVGRRYNVHPVQITKWKQEVLRNAEAAFEKGADDQDTDAEKQRLYAKITPAIPYSFQKVFIKVQ